MYALVGLGNPGSEYKNTRHNVGFLFIDHFGELKNVVTLKPDTFMNNSGKAVKALVEYYKISHQDLFVVHDDLDLRIGEYKIQKGKGPKLHYGINSIEESLKANDFWRIRIGVDNREPENRTPGEAYVLEKFTADEQKILDVIFPKINAELHTMLV